MDQPITRRDAFVFVVTMWLLEGMKEAFGLWPAIAAALVLIAVLLAVLKYLTPPTGRGNRE